MEKLSFSGVIPLKKNKKNLLSNMKLVRKEK